MAYKSHSGTVEILSKETRALSSLQTNPVLNWACFIIFLLSYFQDGLKISGNIKVIVKRETFSEGGIGGTPEDMGGGLRAESGTRASASTLAGVTSPHHRGKLLIWLHIHFKWKSGTSHSEVSSGITEFHVWDIFFNLQGFLFEFSFI